MGARPPRAAVRAAVASALSDLSPGDRVLVALSGGPDSLALVAAAVPVCRDQGLVCAAIVVDHQLQAGSDRVAARAAEQARLLGCPEANVVQVAVPTSGAGGPEAAARDARYAALARAAGVPDLAAARAEPTPASVGVPRAAAVLLGHTMDDQAETVLLGLARGAGTRSLAGMAPRVGLLRRPLLGLRRSLVAAAAAEAAQHDARLQPWADPHNVDPAHARVRVRAGVLPQLEQALGPRVVPALARTADLARADADALDLWADRVWLPVRDQAGPQGGPCLALAVAVLADLPEGVGTRVVRRLLLRAGCPAGALTADHVRRVHALAAATGGRAEVALPGAHRARREGSRLVVRA